MSGIRLGANAFIEQLIAGGVRWIFGNPGTTEQTVIDYLQDYDEIDLVLTLHEGVAVGAADGYARATGQVGVVELHAGPGLGNGIGNLYNSYVSHTPLLVYVGQSEHRSLYQEPVLSADMVRLAAPVTKWAYEVRTTNEIPQIVARALKVAKTPPCGPVLLSIPIDLTDAICESSTVAPTAIWPAIRPDLRALDEAATALLTADTAVIVVGDGSAVSGAISQVSELARLIGAPVFEGSAFETVVENHLALWAGRLPVDPRAAAAALAGYQTVIAIGTRVLAQVFPEPHPPLGDRTVIYVGSDEWELAKNQPGIMLLADERSAIAELTSLLAERADAGMRTTWTERANSATKAIQAARAAQRSKDLAAPVGSLMPVERAVMELCAAIDADVVVVDEAMSAYELVAQHLDRQPGNWFRGAGGIGMGLPRSIGIQIARPDAPVVTVVGDGAAMYSLTAMWTAAHHQLPIVWVVLNNRSYRTLKQNTLKSRRPEVNHQFVGADLSEPEIGFVSIASGMGVESVRVDRLDEIGPTVRAAIERRRPILIDLVVAGDL